MRHHIVFRAILRLISEHDIFFSLSVLDALLALSKVMINLLVSNLSQGLE